MTNSEIIVDTEENKTVDYAKVLEHCSLSGYQKPEENSTKRHKPITVTQRGESVTVVECDEVNQGLAIKNGRTREGRSTSSAWETADGDCHEKRDVKEGLAERYNGTNKGEDIRSLIINYLPQSFTENDVLHYFSPFGLLLQCKVVRDLFTGESKAYGFVKYAAKNSAECAMKVLNGFQVENKKLKVGVARNHCKKIRNSKLYVTHLPKTLDSKGLVKLFKPYGRVLECTVLRDKHWRYRSVGFVRFGLHEHALLALQALNKTRPKGYQKELHVNLVIKRPNCLPLTWNSCERQCHFAGSSRFYSTSPNFQRLPKSHPSFFDRHTSPRRGAFGYYPELNYSYQFNFPGPCWTHSRPMSFGHSLGPDDLYRYGVRSLNNSSVVVFNLANAVDETDLTDIFSELSVVGCRVFRSKGKYPHAYIHFRNYQNALDACKFDGMVVRGRALKIVLKN